MTQTIQMGTDRDLNHPHPNPLPSREREPFEHPRPTYVPGRRHVLDMDDFSRKEIKDTFQNADAMREVMNREIKKVPTLRGKTVITLFTEASTRTRVSFEQAGKILSADVINVSGSGSSVEKGESLYNTALTLQAMNADIIIIRHSHSGAPHFLARHLDACVINAGDGAHAHPTQALLDMYTMRNYFGRVEGLKVAIVGDILYSRVARSNLWGLTAMGADVTLCAPRTLLPQDLLDRRTEVEGHPFADVRIVTDIESALEGRGRGVRAAAPARTTAGRTPAVAQGVLSRLWHQRGAAKARQSRRAGDAPRPDERGRGDRPRSRTRLALGDRGAGHQRRRGPHGAAVQRGHTDQGRLPKTALEEWEPPTKLPLSI